MKVTPKLGDEDYFIHLGKKDILKNGKKSVIKIALNAYNEKDTLKAKHCTDWVNKIFIKATGKRVYDSNTLFNGVKHILEGTGIGVDKYASHYNISLINPGDHVILDLPRQNNEYGLGKTHSVLALGKPNNGILKVISYPKYNTPPVIEYYDLYGK